jgi:hypothetical protein
MRFFSFFCFPNTKRKLEDIIYLDRTWRIELIIDMLDAYKNGKRKINSPQLS